MNWHSQCLATPTDPSKSNGRRMDCARRVVLSARNPKHSHSQCHTVKPRIRLSSRLCSGVSVRDHPASSPQKFDSRACATGYASVWRLPPTPACRTAAGWTVPEVVSPLRNGRRGNLGARNPPIFPSRCALPNTPARDTRSRAQPQYMTASRAIPKRVFAPARIFRARISHVSIFQNVGSAHASRAKHPCKQTPHSRAAALTKAVFSRHIFADTRIKRLFCPRFAPRNRCGNQNRHFPQSLCTWRATNRRRLKAPIPCPTPAEIPRPCHPERNRLPASTKRHMIAERVVAFRL